MHRYELNTCVEPPHNGKITSLSFQPPPRAKSLSSATSSNGKPAGSSPRPLAVTTSEDGKFKSWVLVGGMGEERGGVASWACRSVAYYQSLPCRGASFSSDGSLLASNFKKVRSPTAVALLHQTNLVACVLCLMQCLTLWDPYTCELRRVFSSPFPPETFS